MNRDAGGRAAIVTCTECHTGLPGPPLLDPKVAIAIATHDESAARPWIPEPLVVPHRAAARPCLCRCAVLGSS